jgi:hypothetical protein
MGKNKLGEIKKSRRESEEVCQQLESQVPIREREILTYYSKAKMKKRKAI